MIKYLWYLIFVAVGIFLGTGLYTFFYAKGFSYLSNDPRACVNCHIMNDQYESWVKSSHHHAASCNDCHVPHTFPSKYISKALNGWNHSKAFTLQNYPVPIRITKRNLANLQHNCVICHETLVSEIVGHGAQDQNTVNCTICHRSVGHMSLD